MKIRYKIFFLLLICNKAVITFYTIFNTLVTQHQLNTSINERIAKIKEVIESELAKQISIMSAKTALLSSDINLLNELQKENQVDSAKLNQYIILTAGYLEAIDPKNEFFLFFNRNKQVIFNFSSIEFNNNLIENQMIKSAVLGKTREGITSLIGQQLIIASARPIDLEGKIIGIIFGGKNIGHTLLAEIQNKTGFTLILLRESQIHASSIDIIDYNFIKECDSLLKNQDEKAVSTQPFMLEIDKKSYMFIAFPLYDVQTFSPSSMMLAGFPIDTFLAKQLESLLINVILGIVIIIAILLIGFFITGGISKPLQKISGMLKLIAQGEADLSHRLVLPTRRHDEISELSRWFNLFVEKIKTIILSIKSISDKLNQTSVFLKEFIDQAFTDIEINQNSIIQITQQTEKQVQFTSFTNENIVNTLASINTISNNLEIQNQQVKSVSAQNIDIEKVTKSIQSIVKNANTLSQNLMQSAETGLNNIFKTIDIIKALSIFSKKVTAIMDLIGDITEKIHILSINASIESAKAKNEGKGFSIISKEIGKLAEESKRSGNLIIDAVKIFEKQINEAFNISQNSNQELNNIVELINNNRIIISNIFNLINTQAQKTNEILTSTDELQRLANQFLVEINDQEQVNNQIAISLGSLSKSISEISNSMKKQEQAGNRITSRIGKLNDILIENSNITIELGEILCRFKTE